MENLPVHIREVWEDDLEAEFALIRDIVDDFPFITIDTKFPGNVFRPVGNFETCSDYNYQALKANVDMLKLIQLGLTFSDETGNLPTCGTGKPCVWQFNFCEFILGEDLYEIDSIQMLSQSGIDFEMNERKGVDAHSFAELLMSSGIVLNEDVRLVTFHGGYVFAYLLKLLTGKNLPDTKTGFVKLVKTFFPEFYDIKHMMKFSDGHHGGLNKIAELLGVERIGDHDRRQAGSDSLLTSATFMKRKESFFNGSTEKYEGVLYGLGSEN